MKKITLLTLILVALAVFVFAGDVNLEEQQKLAVSYFVKLTAGDIDAANGMVAAPFSLDLKKVLQTKEEVMGFHKTMLEKKGKRDIPKYTVAPTREALKLDDKVFPPHTPFRIKIEGHGHLDVYVTNSKHPKVIGFAD